MGDLRKETKMRRRLETKIKDDLLKSELWINKIKDDCEKQKVFFAIRDNVVDFYHKGGRLFNYSNMGFITHIKYASVIDSDGKDYITEDDLKNYKFTTDFKNNYKRIKENCSKYSGVEALGVSDIYHQNSFLSDKDVVVLDIEISFKSESEENKQDRIDILLYNKINRTLQFVEAKHFSNGEIWSNTKPKVIDQIKRYEDQIKNNKKEILIEYSSYIQLINSIFNTKLPEPEDIDPKVTLLIFDFDNNQKNGRLKDLIVKNPSFKDIKCYMIGGIKKIVTLNLWNAKSL